DGIRDYKVTGVQTCALPIFNFVSHFEDLFQPSSADQSGDEDTGFEFEDENENEQEALTEVHIEKRVNLKDKSSKQKRIKTLVSRSEERRVGKECRFGSARNK